MFSSLRLLITQIGLALNTYVFGWFSEYPMIGIVVVAPLVFGIVYLIVKFIAKRA